jgi:hypothetical protein
MLSAFVPDAEALADEEPNPNASTPHAKTALSRYFFVIVFLLLNYDSQEKISHE